MGKMKKILILGAGRVTRPAVSYLLKKGYEITLSDISGENLDAISSSCPAAKTRLFNASEGYGAMMEQENPDLVMCMLPPRFMAPVMSLYADRGIHLVHPAYLDDAQRGLSEKIKESGAVMIAELGLDPGIDHMTAAKTIKNAGIRGLRIESYRSVCGALPSPEANNNPWGYKLSWAPESLIGASRRSARVLLDGEEHNWPDGETFEHAYLEDIGDLGCFEVYANADSLPYRNFYGIPDATTIYRGTLRYPGWCETISAMNRLGLISADAVSFEGLTFLGFVARVLGVEKNRAREEFLSRLNLRTNSAIYLRLDWIGFFSDRPIPLSSGTAMDVMGVLFGEKLIFKESERDIVVLLDEFILVDEKSGDKIKSSMMLVDYGIPGGDSAIARTTGLPPAVASDMILSGRITSPGLHIPVQEEIYSSVLDELEKLGIEMTDQEISIA